MAPRSATRNFGGGAIVRSFAILFPRKPSPYVKIWWAVLVNAVCDLYPQKSDKHFSTSRQKAIEFIFRDPDFDVVCNFAGTDPQRFRENCRKLLGQRRPPGIFSNRRKHAASEYSQEIFECHEESEFWKEFGDGR
jgi:hypothetical protein